MYEELIVRPGDMVRGEGYLRHHQGHLWLDPLTMRRSCPYNDLPDVPSHIAVPCDLDAEASDERLVAVTGTWTGDRITNATAHTLSETWVPRMSAPIPDTITHGTPTDIFDAYDEAEPDPLLPDQILGIGRAPHPDLDHWVREFELKHVTDEIVAHMRQHPDIAHVYTTAIVPATR